MGKSLIIPGADFSANKISYVLQWYIDEATIHSDNLSINFASDNYYSTQNIIDSVKGKTIDYVRIPKNTCAGQISLAVFPYIFDEPVSIVDEIQINIPFSENS